MITFPTKSCAISCNFKRSPWNERLFIKEVKKNILIKYWSNFGCLNNKFKKLMFDKDLINNPLNYSLKIIWLFMEEVLLIYQLWTNAKINNHCGFKYIQMSFLFQSSVIAFQSQILIVGNVLNVHIYTLTSSATFTPVMENTQAHTQNNESMRAFWKLHR